MDKNNYFINEEIPQILLRKNVLIKLERLFNCKAHFWTFSELKGGWTNRNFLATQSNLKVVIRIPCKHAHLLGISRKRESKAYLQACSLGLAPTCFESGPNTGFLITEYIPHKPLNEKSLEDPQILKALSFFLKQTHSIPHEKIFGLQDSYGLLNKYFKTAEKHSISLEQKYYSYRDLLYQKRLLIQKRPHVLCHRDLYVPHLFYANNRIQAIDWEYAAWSHPFVDLACICSETYQSSSFLFKLVTAYQNTCSEEDLWDLKVHIALRHLQFCLWSSLQKENSKNIPKEQLQNYEEKNAKLCGLILSELP